MRFLLVLLTGVIAAGTAGAVETFPVELLSPGVKGIGYTVFEGTSVEPFDVEVLGVLEGAGPSGHLYLIRVFGESIERAGGIAAGMSGSPVYVDGKLLGAIGYGFELSDHRIGLVTPAEDMLDVMKRVDAGLPGPPASAPAVPGPPIPHPDLPVPQRVTFDENAPAEGDTWRAAPLRTPLLVSGLGSRAMRRLEEALRSYDVLPVPAGARRGPAAGAQSTSGAAGRDEAAELVPGSAIGVQLARGAVDVTAIGTVTAVEDGRFVAFGHPFLRKGAVEYIASAAEIVRVVPSLSIPFKLGAPLGEVGVVTQDRGAGVAGRLNRSASTVGVRVRVEDRELATDQSFMTEIVPDDVLLVPLALVAALEAFDRSLDRIGSGKASVRVRVEGEGLPKPFERENLFYSESDIAAAALSELGSVLAELHENPFAAPEFTAITIEASIDRDRPTARIVGAHPERREVAPGESVDVTVRLRPFRGAVVELTLPFEVPADTPPGSLYVTVRGGGSSFDYFSEDLEGDLEEGEWDEPQHEEDDIAEKESFEQLIDELASRPKNNEIVFEYYPPESYDEGPEEEYGPLEAHGDGGDEDESEGGADGGDDVGGADSGGPVDPGVAGDDADEGPDEPGGGELTEGGLEEHEAAPAFGEPYETVEPVQRTYPTEYVVEGETSFTVDVVVRR